MRKAARELRADRIAAIAKEGSTNFELCQRFSISNETLCGILRNLGCSPTRPTMERPQ